MQDDRISKKHVGFYRNVKAVLPACAELFYQGGMHSPVAQPATRFVDFFSKCPDRQTNRESIAQPAARRMKPARPHMRNARIARMSRAIRTRNGMMRRFANSESALLTECKIARTLLYSLRDTVRRLIRR